MALTKSLNLSGCDRISLVPELLLGVPRKCIKLPYDGQPPSKMGSGLEILGSRQG